MCNSIAVVRNEAHGRERGCVTSATPASSLIKPLNVLSQRSCPKGYPIAFQQFTLPHVGKSYFIIDRANGFRRETQLFRLEGLQSYQPVDREFYEYPQARDRSRSDTGNFNFHSISCTNMLLVVTAQLELYHQSSCHNGRVYKNSSHQ
jgi:hypothetical protein